MKAYEVPESRKDAEAMIKQIGLRQRELSTAENKLSDKVAKTKEGFEGKLKEYQDDIQAMQNAIQAYAEKHREELIPEGKKSTKLNGGEIGWRTTKDKVVCKNTKHAVQVLKDTRKKKFLRTSESLDKSAILKEPNGLPEGCGIEIQPGQDVFWIKPAQSKAR